MLFYANAQLVQLFSVDDALFLKLRQQFMQALPVGELDIAVLDVAQDEGTFRHQTFQREKERKTLFGFTIARVEPGAQRADAVVVATCAFFGAIETEVATEFVAPLVSSDGTTKI